MTEEIEDYKLLSSIIEFRCGNLLRANNLLRQDIEKLHEAKSIRNKNKICENIYIKIEYIEILLSKCIDDALAIEIIESDNISNINLLTQPNIDDYQHYQ